MNNSSSTCAVTVTYNHSEQIAQLIHTLAPQVRELWVIDNDSQDGTVNILQQMARTYSNLRPVYNRTNVGFAQAVNIGLEHIEESVLLINPDCQVPQGSIAALEERSRHFRDEWILAPALEYPDGRPQASARTFPSLLTVLAKRTPLRKTAMGRRLLDEHLSLANSRQPNVYVDWAIGAALFVPGPLRAKIGLMDARYFLYCEDMDWCMRAWQLGAGVILAQDVRVTHAYGEASKSTFDLRSKAVRLHWQSLVKFSLRNPALFYLGRKVDGTRHGQEAQ